MRLSHILEGLHEIGSQCEDASRLAEAVVVHNVFLRVAQIAEGKEEVGLFCGRCHKACHGQYVPKGWNYDAIGNGQAWLSDCHGAPMFKHKTVHPDGSVELSDPDNKHDILPVGHTDQMPW